MRRIRKRSWREPLIRVGDEPVAALPGMALKTTSDEPLEWICDVELECGHTAVVRHTAAHRPTLTLVRCTTCLAARERALNEWHNRMVGRA